MTQREQILTNLECIQRCLDGIRRAILAEDEIDLTEQAEGLKKYGH